MCVTHARIAADILGATKMDRPEWGGVNPLNGEAYMTLTNNSNRVATSTTPTGSQLKPDAANPRYYEDMKGTTSQKGNPNGHIIRWREAGGTSLPPASPGTSTSSQPSPMPPPT